MPSETIKLTIKFRIKKNLDGLDELFSTYHEIVDFLLDYAFEHNITSFYRLKSEKYKALREKYPELPSHYHYTACQMTISILKSYRKRKRKGKAKGKPVFKKDVIMLDDHLFKLDLDKGVINLSTPQGRLRFEFYPAKYHEKFKDWKVGQAWLVKTSKGVFINVVFSKGVEVKEPETFVGIDLNENNIAIATPVGFYQIITHEREIRTGYFVKRRKIQKKLRTGKNKKELLEKYGKREKNRLNDLYHKLASKIVELAKRYGGIALEDLTGIRKRIRYSAEMNGRLHRWSFCKLQSVIEYKAKLNGIKVVFVNPAYTSSRCLICGEKLSPNGYRALKCPNCGFEADRDVVGSWNIRLRGLKMWGVTVSPEAPPMKTGGGKPILYEVNTFNACNG